MLRWFVVIGMLAAPWLAKAQIRVEIDQQCAACHGQDGIARDMEVPHLAGQNERYLLNQIMAFKNGTRSHKESAVHGARDDRGGDRRTCCVLRLACPTVETPAQKIC